MTRMEGYFTEPRVYQQATDSFSGISSHSWTPRKIDKRDVQDDEFLYVELEIRSHRGWDKSGRYQARKSRKKKKSSGIFEEQKGNGEATKRENVRVREREQVEEKRY